MLLPSIAFAILGGGCQSTRTDLTTAGREALDAGMAQLERINEQIAMLEMELAAAKRDALAMGDAEAAELIASLEARLATARAREEQIIEEVAAKAEGLLDATEGGDLLGWIIGGAGTALGVPSLTALGLILRRLRDRTAERNEAETRERLLSADFDSLVRNIEHAKQPLRANLSEIVLDAQKLARDNERDGVEGRIEHVRQRMRPEGEDA